METVRRRSGARATKLRPSAAIGLGRRRMGIEMLQPLMIARFFISGRVFVVSAGLGGQASSAFIP